MRETGLVPQRKKGVSVSIHSPPSLVPRRRIVLDTMAFEVAEANETPFVRTSTRAKGGAFVPATVLIAETGCAACRCGSLPPGFVPPMATAPTRPATSAPLAARFMLRTAAASSRMAGDFAAERPRATAPAVPHIAISATPNISGEPGFISGSGPPDRCQGGRRRSRRARPRHGPQGGRSSSLGKNSIRAGRRESL